jgi:malate dehydrogenase (oxaloacetate-decarboxylating)(NADP+)
MRQAPGRPQQDPRTGELYLEVPFAGDLLTNLPLFNKGTAFTERERDELGLRGLVPPRVFTMEQQIGRILEGYARQRTDLDRHIFLIALMDRNETLFYRVVLDHIREMLPILYTPTVGQACARFGHIYRRPRGLYVTIDDAERIDALLDHWYTDEVEAIVVTDGERILGLGDLGAGGMGISIGKLTLYTVAGGIDPARVMPVCLDVGTDRAELLADPLYLGTPRRRVRGAPYDRLVDAFIDAVARRFPHALIQFEDFAVGNALRLLERYRDRACCFNDDVQGTGAVALAGLGSAMRLQKIDWPDARVLIVGAGSAGIGIARAIDAALREAGRDPRAHLFLADSKGLLTRRREDLTEYQRPFAAPASGARDLAGLVRELRPTALIGVTGVPGLFSRAVLEAAAAVAERPAIFPLSNPTTHSECSAEEAREATKRRAIVAAGSPFPDTDQANNLYVFPGVGLAVTATRARRVTDRMFLAAARRLSELAQGDRLYPDLSQVRDVSALLAQAVADQALADGVADRSAGAVEIRARMWEPRYLPYRRAVR